jgi:chromosome segregation ATPase
MNMKTLQGQLDELEAQHRALTDEITGLESKRAGQQTALDTLKAKYDAACAREAQGQSSSDRKKFESEIDDASAKIRGFGFLIASKVEERAKLRQTIDTVGAELRRVQHGADVQNWLAELDKHCADGKREIQEILSLQRRFADRVRVLRTAYTDPAVSGQAFEVAEKLSNAFAGRHLTDVFSREEIAALGEQKATAAVAAD